MSFILLTILLLTGRVTTVGKAIKIVGLMELIKYPVMFVIPACLDFILEMKASASRIQVY